MKFDRVYGISKTGPGHIRLDLPNQDSFLCRKFGFLNKYSLCVVSDGMGSKKHADVGAQAVCNAVLNASKKYLRRKTKEENLFGMILNEWKNLISPYTPDECSATCLFALRTKKKILVAMLGDGMIFVNGKEQNHSEIFLEEKNDDFSNVTKSISCSDYGKNWNIKVFAAKDVKSILVATDGISSDLAEAMEIDFSYALLRELELLRSTRKKTSYLEKLIDEWPVPKHSDDKTIAILEL